VQRPSWPLRELQRSLERIARMHRFAMGDNYALEWKVEHRTQVRKGAFLVSGRHPYPQHSSSLGERVGEHEGPMLGKPEGRFVPAPGIPKGAQAAGKLLVQQDLLHLGFGGPHIGIECVGPECTTSVAADQGVHTPGLPIGPGRPHMIWTKHRHGRWRPLREAVPNESCAFRWKKRIEQPPFAARVDADASHHLLPVMVGLPLGMLEPPDPQTGREIDNVHIW